MLAYPTRSKSAKETRSSLARELHQAWSILGWGET
jgi:hypothetical protein